MSVPIHLDSVRPDSLNALGSPDSLDSVRFQSVKLLDPEQLTHQELVDWCDEIGRIAVRSRRMFVGLLPLVERRQAYNVKKFSSIHHFANVVGGVSREIVDEVLRLDNQLSHMPLLRRALYSGEIGWSKIRSVVSLITRENEASWLELLKTLPRAALAVYLRDWRRQELAENLKLLQMSCFPGETAISTLDGEVGQVSESVERVVNGESVVHAEEQENAVLESTQRRDLDGSFRALADVQANLYAHIHTHTNTVQPDSVKAIELAGRQEVMRVSMNALTAARLRLYRQVMERRLRRFVPLGDAIQELLDAKSNELPL